MSDVCMSWKAAVAGEWVAEAVWDLCTTVLVPGVYKWYKFAVHKWWSTCDVVWQPLHVRGTLVYPKTIVP